jgi:hypothetical protein
MDLRCEDVRNDALPLSEERAEQIARHLDGCETCDRDLRARTAAAVDAIPSGAAPSMAEVRRRIRNDRLSSVAAGSWGGQRPSLADYVTVIEARDRATAARRP